MLSLEGQQLGNYDVIRRIRVGGMGAVYEGRQRTAFDRRVAIKVILGNYAADKDMRRRFAREARTIARLHHPHILPLIEFGDERGILYLVMPFIDGGTLTGYLRRTLPDLEEVSTIYQQLLDAVEYAHEEGLIHRDIKSSNILLEQKRSGPPYVYLADFGLVRTIYQTNPQQVGKPIPLDQVPGTPHYMAPEQTFGIITPLTDIYALGVLLYQMLTGELPYNNEDDVQVIQMHLQDPIPSPCERDASIPIELAAVVRGAMAKKPEERYQTVEELRHAFLDAVKGPEVSRGPDTGTSLAALKALTRPLSPLSDTPIVEVPMPIKRKTPQVPLPLTLHEPTREPIASPRIPMPRRSRKDASTIAVHAQHGKIGSAKVSISDVMTRKQESNGTRKRTRLKPWLIFTLVIMLVLAALLTLPPLLGLHIPGLGSPSISMVYITPKTQNIQDTFVLTASNQVSKPDFVTHTIPAHQWQASASDSISVQTSGSKIQGGAPSHGILVFTNATNQPVTLAPSFTLTTPSGTRLQLIQGVTIPAHLNGQDGKASTPAQAVAVGVEGNLAAHSVDGPCCSVGISVRNPATFSGGVDGQMVHVLSQADLDSARNALAPRLEQQIVQQIKQRLSPDDLLAGQPNYTIAVTSDNMLGAQVDHVQVSVAITGNATTYSSSQSNQTAIQLLNKRATEILDSNYQRQGDAVLLGQPAVEAGQNGVLYIRMQVGGTWIYQHTKQQIGQWTQSIRGATSVAANAYLIEQPGVANAQISLPFGSDRLPTSYNQIKIVLIKPGG